MNTKLRSLLALLLPLSVLAGCGDRPEDNVSMEADRAAYPEAAPPATEEPSYGSGAAADADATYSMEAPVSVSEAPPPDGETPVDDEEIGGPRAKRPNN